MPIITCTKCQGKLRFPDDSPPRRVKCPTCGNVFMSTEGMVPGTVPAATDRPPPTPKAQNPRDEGRTRHRDEDEDFDRGRRRDDYRDEKNDRRPPRREDENDDDWDRRSRRRDRDDDDRDRQRRRDDDYDDRRRRRGPDLLTIEGRFNRASLACLLCFIGGWLQVGAAGLIAFTVFLHWVGVEQGLQVFLVIAGLLGLGYWLTSATGLGFMVSGPRERGALGFSIATAAVGGLHLLLLIVTATSHEFGPFGGSIFGLRPADVSWDGFVTQLRALPYLLFAEIGMGDVWRNVAKGSLLSIFTNMTEIGRMVLFFLTLRAVMFCARDRDGARLSMQALVGFAIGAGGLLLLGILFGLLLLAARPDAMTGKSESISAVFHLYYLILYLVLTGLSVGTALIVRSVKGRLDYRP